MFNKLFAKLLYLSNETIYKIFAVILSFLALILYLPVINFGFVADDHWLVPMSFKEAMDVSLTSRDFRPVWLFSFPVVNALFGSSSLVHHTVNVSLHLTNCLLAISIIRKFLIGPIAIIVVALWSLLPWVAFPIAWISQRNDLLMSFFILLALHPLAKKRANICILISLSFFSKVTSLFFFLIFCFKQGIRREKVDLLYGICFFLVALAIALLALRNQNPPRHLIDLPLIIIILNQIKNVIIGWLTFFIPIPFLFTPVNILGYMLFLTYLIWATIKYGQFTYESHRFLLYSFLMSIPMALAIELRITYLQSLFFLIALFSSLHSCLLVNNRGLSKPSIAFSILVTLFLLYSIPAIHATLQNFNTRVYSISDIQERTIITTASLYPNDFYSWLTDFQRDLLQVISN